VVFRNVGIVVQEEEGGGGGEGGRRRRREKGKGACGKAKHGESRIFAASSRRLISAYQYWIV